MNIKSIVFFSTVIFAVLFLWLFVWPTAQDAIEMKKSIDNKYSEKAVLESTQESIEDAISFYRSAPEEDLELIDLAVPADDDRINLSNILKRTIEENGLIETGIRVTQESATTRGGLAAAPSGNKKVAIAMNMEGTYQSFKQFIRALEGNLRIINIEYISITSSVSEVLGGGTEVTYAFSVTGNAYYLPPPAPSETGF